MGHGVKVRSGVDARRAIAAADMTTGLAYAEMDPVPLARSQAVLATVRGRNRIGDLVDMAAQRCDHEVAPCGSEGMAHGKSDRGVPFPWARAPAGALHPVTGNDPCCQPIVPGAPALGTGAVLIGGAAHVVASGSKPYQVADVENQTNQQVPVFDDAAAR